MDYLKNNIFNILTAIPLILLAIGSFVISLHLSKYGIMDFPIFDARTLFVGFIAILQIMTFVVIWFVYISYKGELVFLIINSILKPLLFSSIICVPLIVIDEASNYKIYNWVFDIKVMLIVSIMSNLIGSTIFIIENDYTAKGEKNKLGFISLCVVLFFILIGCASFTLVVFFEKNYRNIYLTFQYISVLLFLSTIYIWDSQNSKSRGLGNGVSSFSSNEKKYTKMDIFFSVIGIFLFMIMSLVNYTKNIYPLMLTNIGGGKYHYNTVELKDGQILKGQIIHNNSQYLYIIDSMKILNQIKQDAIVKYYITN